MVKSVLVKGPVSRGSSAAATEVKAGPAVPEIITGGQSGACGACGEGVQAETSGQHYRGKSPGYFSRKIL